MSRNSQPVRQREQPRKSDRRIARTRNRLGNALISLILEKPFDSITVQQVLDRADVSRSTFYTHFKDKDDLLLSDLEDFFTTISTALTRRQENSDRVMPVRELFAHVREAQNLLKALIDSGRYHDMMELAQGEFSRGIEQRMANNPRGQRIPKDMLSASAHAHAGALLSLMNWWIQRGKNKTPEEMDDLFHAMVWGRDASKRTQSAHRSAGLR
jgi:AcrR family transcriptional regulator